MESTSTGPGSLIGATLGGYEVVALIGRGAMGTVYLARDLKLNRLVALKVLLGSLAKTKSLVEQFHKEAQAVAPLNHPGIVRVYSAGTEQGIPFIVMEFVDGEPLDKFLQRKGKMKWDVALHICTKLAQALERAHRSGIVHRDIKPSNIMLDKKGGVRLMDFGIASLQADGGGGHSFLGTPQYMSPEQARNGEVGPSSDLYSLGVTLYQMISGTMPFTGETSLALINSICNDDAPRLNASGAEVPDDVARFVAYLMGKTPRQRPANAKVVHGMVARLLRQKGELNSMSTLMTEFIQTEMEVSPFSSLQQKPKKFKVAKTQDEINEARVGKQRLYSIIMRVFLVAFLGLSAYFLGTHSQRTVQLDVVQEVPSVDALSIRKGDGGISIVELNRPHYTVSDVHWLGDDATLWLELMGEVGSMGHGAVGGVGVDLVMGRSFAVLPVQSPLLSTQVDDVYLHSMEQVEFTRTGQGNERSTELLLFASDYERDEVVVMSRAWNKAYPSSRVLLRIPRNQWVWSDKDDVLKLNYASAVLHPTGQSIVYTVYDPENDYSYISEQSIDAVEHNYREVGERKTSESNNVIPGSVQFSPQASDILYWRKRSGIGAELWRIQDGFSTINGDRILSGVMGDEYSISPDGKSVAIQYDDGRGGVPQVVLVQLASGGIIARLGAGTVSRHSWHPTQPYIVIRQSLYKDGALNDQLVAVNVEDFEERTILTDRAGGVSSAYAISPDGRKLAVVKNGTALPSVFVLDWQYIEFDVQ